MGRLRKRWIVLGVTAAALGGFVIINWRNLPLTIAILLSPRRPALLQDANWKDPASAQAFNARFPAGAAERALTEWLTSNGFTIDPASRRAMLHINSVPCNEGIEVNWTATPAGILQDTSVIVEEAGCL